MTILSHHAIRLRFALVGLLALAGCATSDTDAAGPAASSPVNLVDSFLIARGMEFSYGGSGRAGPQEIAQLIQYDHAALLAVVSAAHQPNDVTTRKAQRALKTLVDYTAANDLAPEARVADPVLAPPPPPAGR